MQVKIIHESSTHSDSCLESSTNSDSSSSENNKGIDNTAKYINEVSLHVRITQQRLEARETAKELIVYANERDDNCFLQIFLTDTDYSPIDETFNKGTDSNISSEDSNANRDYDSDD